MRFVSAGSGLMSDDLRRAPGLHSIAFPLNVATNDFSSKRGRPTGKVCTMAQKTQIILVDDIDGSAATQTVTFALDGVTYEIDLNDDHAAALRETIEEWVPKARRSGGRRNVRRRAGSGNSANTQKIREWARANGYDISDRGRIPSSIAQAYTAAH